jgi:hypothetical protein
LTAIQYIRPVHTAVYLILVNHLVPSSTSSEIVFIPPGILIGAEIWATTVKKTVIGTIGTEIGVTAADNGMAGMVTIEIGMITTVTVADVTTRK